MVAVDNIRNGLIDKILSIKNRELLEALDKLITSSASESENVKLTDEQKMMMEMSEQDIRNAAPSCLPAGTAGGQGNLISQEAMDKRNLQWLNEL